MKRFLCILLICLMITPALAESIDLSALSFDELRSLQTQLNKELVSRPEWKEVTVPMGIWVVGSDIPAGAYSIISTDSSTFFAVWEKAVNDYSGMGCIYNEVINNKNKIGRIVLQDGWVVEFNDPVIFAPAVSLGF